MTATTAMPTLAANDPVALTDAALVARSAAGDRGAFALIVARYQRLVCSVAYSATGSITQSEDLAQETFLTAWRQLPQLRDAESLRAWLCGITRNLTRNLHRRASNDLLLDDDVVDAASHVATDDPAPTEQAIRDEEQAILWRAIGRVPELYREPLVLFYREHQSIERVAEALALNEATVRQRLARGRRLLQDEVLSFVEGALGRSAPGEAFTLAVIAAIPTTATTTATVAVGASAAHGSALVKSAALFAWMATVFGPLISLVSGFFAVRASLDTARTARERTLTVRAIATILGGALVFTAALVALIVTGSFWARHPLAFTLVGATIPLGFAAWFAYMVQSGITAQRRVRAEEFASGDALTFRTGYREYRSAKTFLGLPLVHTRLGVPPVGTAPVRAWIAVGDRAIGGLFALGGITLAPISVGSVAFGGIAVGTVSIGLMPMAAVAIGLYALGSAALGWFAVGGFAVGAHAAAGGLAVARDFAGGGFAVATHANDLVAQQALTALLPGWLFVSMFVVLAVLAIGPTAWYAHRVRRLARHTQE
jgi:RNA polymerase sigma factor (sigma-70 family)